MLVSAGCTAHAETASTGVSLSHLRLGEGGLVIEGETDLSRSDTHAHAVAANAAADSARAPLVNPAL